MGKYSSALDSILRYGEEAARKAENTKRNPGAALRYANSPHTLPKRKEPILPQAPESVTPQGDRGFLPLSRVRLSAPPSYAATSQGSKLNVGVQRNNNNDTIFGQKSKLNLDSYEQAQENKKKKNAKSELNKILDKQYEKYKTEDIVNVIKETGVANEVTADYTVGQNVIGRIADKRMNGVFDEIDANKKTVLDAEKEFGVPKEVIASIMLKEGYTRSIPDWLANVTTTIGKRAPFFAEKAGKIFGEHSTGLGAIFPNIARTAWEAYLGKEQADQLLPKDDLNLQYLIKSDNEFNIKTIGAVLAYEAKRFGYNSRDDLQSLTYEEWNSIVPYYNGDPIKYHEPIKYGQYVAEYLPYMKEYLE
ncbi:MAG: hypothetical protein RR009_07935 [Oscillospiraceae bacterium]